MSRRARRRAGGVDGMVNGAARHGAARLWPYSPPWLFCTALPVLAGGCRLLAGRGLAAAMLVAVGLTVSVAGMTAFTWHVFKARGQSIRVHATVFAAGCGLWVLWSAIVGLDAWPVWAVWAFASVAGSLTWSIRRAARGDGADGHDAGDGGFMELVGVAGRPAGQARLEADGARVRLPVQLNRGEATVEDLQAARGRVASAAGVRRGAVRVEPNPDDHSRGDLVVVPRDLLAETIRWAGPAAPGQSISEALQVGRYEGGDSAQLWLPGDPKARPAPRNATHLGVMGMTGAGKSEGVLILLAEAMTRPDCSIVYSDPVKGLQTVAPVAAGVGLLVTEQKLALSAFRALPKVIRARTAAMGRAGFRQWSPDVHRKIGLKYLIYVWEEAADLLADSELFVKVTEQARSAGITLIPSQQRFSHDRMNTSARYNLMGGWCFGTGDAKSAEFALSPQTIDAGACPEEWKANKPGYSYLEAPGVPESRWAEPLRAFLGEPAQLREAVAEYCRDAALDPVTASAFGKVYGEYRRMVLDGAAEWQQSGRTAIPMPGGNRTESDGLPSISAERRESPANRPDAPDSDEVSAGQTMIIANVDNMHDSNDLVGVLVEMPGAPPAVDTQDPVTIAGIPHIMRVSDDLDAGDPDGDDEYDVRQDPDLPPMREQPEPGFMDDIDPAEEIPAGEDPDPPITWGPPPGNPRPTASAARQMLRDELTRRAAGGADVVTTAELAEFRAQRLHRSASWLSGELRTLVDEGTLEALPDRGAYGLRVSVPV